MARHAAQRRASAISATCSCRRPATAIAFDLGLIDAVPLVRLADRPDDNTCGCYLRSLSAERAADALAR
jgi:hypothetical protein